MDLIMFVLASVEVFDLVLPNLSKKSLSLRPY